MAKLHGNKSRSSGRVTITCFLCRYPAIASHFARSGIETGIVAFLRLGILSNHSVLLFLVSSYNYGRGVVYRVIRSE